MKKTIFLIIPILFLCINLFSQEETERKWAVKAYVNGSYYSTQSIITNSQGNIETSSSSSVNIGMVSPAISYTKGKFLQELELTNLRINRTDNSRIIEIVGQDILLPISGGINKSTELGLRYLASGVFRPFKIKKISLGIGGSIQPYFFHYRYIPNTSANFPTKVYRLGSKISVVPQIEYDFHKRFFINLSSPFEILDIRLNSSRLDNPIIPESERTTRKGEAEIFPQIYHLRAAIGIRF